MKRGLVEWDPKELSREALQERVARCQAWLAEHGLDAVVFYTSVAQPVLVRYLTHFLPYWNEGVLVLPREGEPLLLVGLSNRVFPWIKGSSTLTEVRASRNLGADAGRYLHERGAARVGLADSGSMPYRVSEALRASLAGGQVVDATELTAMLRLGADADELRLRGRAGELATQALAKLAADGIGGRSDREVAAHLERGLRLAGAEDTLVLVGPAGRWPGLPSGTALGERAHVVVQVEYKGHWVQVGRTLNGGVWPGGSSAWRERLGALCAPGHLVAEVVAAARAQDGAEVYVYRSGRGAPFTGLGEGDRIADGDVIAVLALRPASSELDGDTFAVRVDGLQLLS